MNKWLVIIIIGLSAALLVSLQEVRLANEKWSIAEANVKAYSQELSESEHRSTTLQLTVSQLEYFKDSVIQKLDEVRKELKIKDKNLKALQAVSSSFSVNDTILLRDTIFKDPSFNLDTLLGNQWYSVLLGLHYPSSVTVEPTFKSEKYIVVSSKRETVNPPKKFFLLRWFQKRHTVLHVDVVEKNPYADNQKSKYIEIIK